MISISLCPTVLVQGRGHLVLNLPLKKNLRKRDPGLVGPTAQTKLTKPGTVLPNALHLHSHSHLVVPGVLKYTPQPRLGWPTTQEEMHTPTWHCLPECHCLRQQRPCKTLQYQKVT